MYLRCKRKHQTIFLHCEPSQRGQAQLLPSPAAGRFSPAPLPSASALLCWSPLPLCSGEKLQQVKERLALIVGKDEDDIRLHELLSDERAAALAQQQQAERLAKAAKQQKSLYAASPPPAFSSSSSSSSSSQSALAEFVQPPLDTERKIGELGLETDAIVLFVYRSGQGEEWEEMEAEAVMEKKAAGTAGAAAAGAGGAGGSSRRSEEKDEYDR